MLFAVCSVRCGKSRPKNGINSRHWPKASSSSAPSKPSVSDEFSPSTLPEFLSPPDEAPLPKTHTSVHKTIVKHVEVRNSTWIN